MKYLFDELIETKDVYLIIDQSNPSAKDREYLVTIVKDTIHHKLVDLVLDELSSEQQMYFLEKIDNENHHPELLNKLGKWINDFELKVVRRVQEAEQEILELLNKDII